MKNFKRLYVWGLNMKYFMGLYFAALVFFSGCVLALFGIFTIRLLVLLEMLFACAAVGTFQTFILPDDIDLTGRLLIARTLVFSLISAGFIALCSVWGKWFAPLGIAANLILGALMLAGFFATLLGIRYQQEMESASLNERLAKLRREEE